MAVAQVDDMSDGRVELGLGAGWFDDEHTAYGIPFPALGERFDRLEEQLEIITGMWRAPIDSQYSFEGRHYTVVGSPALPKPVQPGGPPIIIGGFGAKRTPRLAARYASEFNVPFAPVAGLRRPGRAGRRPRARPSGAIPTTSIFSSAQVLCCGESHEDQERRAGVIGRALDDDLKVNARRRFAGRGARHHRRLRRGRARSACTSRCSTSSDLEHLDLVGEQVLRLLPEPWLDGRSTAQRVPIRARGAR